MGKTIHLVSILDRSGSMSGNETEVIGAYNNFIKEQRKLAAEKNLTMKASLILFDDRYEEVYNKTPLADVPELTSDVYNVRGMTALFDAIGKTIMTFDSKKNVIFFIETDGLENSSREYSSDTLKALVSKKEKEGWDFNFVGADLSTAMTKSIGAAIGISKTMAFDKSHAGYQTRNAFFSGSTLAYSEKV